MTINTTSYTLEVTHEELSIICTSLNASYLRMCEEYQELMGTEENKNCLTSRYNRMHKTEQIARITAECLGVKFIEFGGRSNV